MIHNFLKFLFTRFVVGLLVNCFLAVVFILMTVFTSVFPHYVIPALTAFAICVLVGSLVMDMFGFREIL